MIINKNSWHYRLFCFHQVMSRYLDYKKHIDKAFEEGKSFTEIYDLVDERYTYTKFRIFKNPPKDFCTYWRQAIVAPIIAFTLIIVLLLSLLFLFINFPMNTLIVAGFVFGGVLLAFLFLLLIAGTSMLMDKVKNKSIDVENNVIIQGFLSKKNKICKLVEYKDE